MDYLSEFTCLYKETKHSVVIFTVPTVHVGGAAEKRWYQTMGVTNINRDAASQPNANRTNYFISSGKTIAVVNCSASLILDSHCPMTQSFDSQIGWKVLKRELHRVETFITDK